MSKETLATLLGMLFIIVVLGASLVTTAKYLPIAMDEYAAEGACATKLVSEGTERRDIVTNNGTCSIKLN